MSAAPAVQAIKKKKKRGPHQGDRELRPGGFMPPPQNKVGAEVPATKAEGSRGCYDEFEIDIPSCGMPSDPSELLSNIVLAFYPAPALPSPHRDGPPPPPPKKPNCGRPGEQSLVCACRLSQHGVLHREAEQALRCSARFGETGPRCPQRPNSHPIRLHLSSCTVSASGTANLRQRAPGGNRPHFVPTPLSPRLLPLLPSLRQRRRLGGGRRRGAQIRVSAPCGARADRARPAAGKYWGGVSRVAAHDLNANQRLEAAAAARAEKLVVEAGV